MEMMSAGIQRKSEFLYQCKSIDEDNSPYRNLHRLKAAKVSASSVSAVAEIIVKITNEQFRR